MTGQTGILLCGLFLTHYLGDFTPLATRRMLEAKLVASPMRLIAAHAGVHASLVAIVVALVALPAWPIFLLACAIEFVTHFLIDAARALLGRRHSSLNDPAQPVFWRLLGFDQLAHGGVLIAVAAVVVQ